MKKKRGKYVLISKTGCFVSIAERDEAKRLADEINSIIIIDLKILIEKSVGKLANLMDLFCG